MQKRELTTTEQLVKNINRVIREAKAKPGWCTCYYPVDRSAPAIVEVAFLIDGWPYCKLRHGIEVAIQPQDNFTVIPEQEFAVLKSEEIGPTNLFSEE